MLTLRQRSFRRSILVIASALLASFVVGGGGYADDSSQLVPTPTSIRAHETKLSTRDFGAESRGTAGYEMTFLLYCLKELSFGRTNDAIRDCSEAISLNPRSAAGYKLRGMANFGEGRYDDALADLDRARALDPRDPEILSAKGAAFRARGETDRAVEAYSQAIALETSDGRWWNARCWTRAVARKELMLALSDCNEAISLDLHSAQALDSRGLVYVQLKRSREAIRDYSHALSMKPIASSFFGRGVAKLRIGDQSGYRDIARARAMDQGIDKTFRRYGIVVNSPFQLRVPRGSECDGDECPAIRPSLKPPPPMPPNEAQPARSASVDMDHSDAHRRP